MTTYKTGVTHDGVRDRREAIDHDNIQNWCDSRNGVRDHREAIDHDNMQNWCDSHDGVRDCGE